MITVKSEESTVRADPLFVVNTDDLELALMNRAKLLLYLG